MMFPFFLKDWFSNSFFYDSIHVLWFSFFLDLSRKFLLLCDHIEYVIALGILGFSIFSFLHLEKNYPNLFSVFFYSVYYCFMIFNVELSYPWLNLPREVKNLNWKAILNGINLASYFSTRAFWYIKIIMIQCVYLHSAGLTNFES